MVMLGPASTIFFVDKNNTEHYDEAMSAASDQIISRISGQMGLPVSVTMPLDSLQKEEAVGFMRYLDGVGMSMAGKAPIPSALDDMLEDAGCRYGLLIYADGMRRDKEGYLRDAAVGAFFSIFVAVVTLGMVVPYMTPTAYTSMVSVAILDSYTDSVVYYGTHQPGENDPLQDNTIRRQLKRLLKGFY